MSERPMKRVADSVSEQVHVLAMESINGAQRLLGSRLMDWIDDVSVVVARRHSGRRVTTVLVDRIAFLAAAHLNDTVVVSGKITYAGTSSMEISVKTYLEELDGTQKLINDARLVMVALDDDERPCPVPGLILETDEEKQAWEEGRQRAAARKASSKA